MTSDALKPVFRHHATETRVAVATPVEPVPGDVEVEKPGRGFNNADAFGRHLLADSVALDHRDLERHALPCPIRAADDARPR